MRFLLQSLEYLQPVKISLTCNEKVLEKNIVDLSYLLNYFGRALSPLVLYMLLEKCLLHRGRDMGSWKGMLNCVGSAFIKISYCSRILLCM